MNHLRHWSIALLVCSGLVAAHAQTVRPAIGQPLQQASEWLKAGKPKEALAKVRETDAVGNKTAAEQQLIDRMKGAAAQRAGDHATAIQAFESLFNSGLLGAGERAQMAEQIAYAYSQQKDWPRTQQWIQRAQAAGSRSAQLQQLQAYAQSQSGDYAAIARDAQAAVAAAEAAGRKPDEGDLLRLADAQQRTGNLQGRIATLDKLLVHHPKKEYWSVRLSQLPRKSGFSTRFALDVFRLRLATGTLSRADDYMEMAQLALQAGYPAEGKAVIDQGFAGGVLGSGPEGERHRRLRDLAARADAEARTVLDQNAQDAAARQDGNALVQMGYAHVTLGQIDQGIALIEQGIVKGSLKHPQDAKLHLGLALLQSGQHRAKAMQILRSVQGTDGAAELARLWAVYASQTT